MVERALALAAAPATWVFGSVPDWFSDAVFQVRTREIRENIWDSVERVFGSLDSVVVVSGRVSELLDK